MIRCNLILALALFAPVLHAVEVADVLSMARSRIAPEAKLNAVTSIQYFGKVYGPEGEENSTLELMFQKPDQQKLIVDSADVKSETAVNGFEGYIEVFNKVDTYKSGVLVLDANRVRRLIANASENLYFFEGPYHRTGGKITLAGTKKIRGKECYEVRFSYPSGLYYIRYFDTKTGDLLSTINGETNQEMVESDSIMVDGIRFPKTVKTYDDEGDLVRTVVFDKIILNEKIDDSVFDFPDIPASTKSQ